jgi:hypothetical protein
MPKYQNQQVVKTVREKLRHGYALDILTVVLDI